MWLKTHYNSSAPVEPQHRDGNPGTTQGEHPLSALNTRGCGKLWPLEGGKALQDSEQPA